jgi:hypothetical protein
VTVGYNAWLELPAIHPFRMLIHHLSDLGHGFFFAGEIFSERNGKA